MECQSKKFSKLIVDLLSAKKPVVASISDKGIGLIADLKKRKDVKVVEVRHDNADILIKVLTMQIRDILMD
jgi:nucleoside-triphosphatase THEP1